MLDHPWRAEIEVDQIPAPARIAPYSCAVAADVLVEDTEVGNGRLVLLHDPAGNDAWEGTYRLVSFAHADVDIEMVTDPLLLEVGWSWMLDALTDHDASYVAASGTVTSVASRGFGALAEDPTRGEVEIRSSWTPLIQSPEDLVPHLRAWGDLLCQVAGLPPLPQGVTPLLPRVR